MEGGDTSAGMSLLALCLNRVKLPNCKILYSKLVDSTATHTSGVKIVLCDPIPFGCQCGITQRKLVETSNYIVKEEQRTA